MEEKAKEVEQPAIEQKKLFTLVFICTAANSEQIKLAIRSYEKNIVMPFSVVVIGEKQDWMNEKITVIPAKDNLSSEELVQILLDADCISDVFAIAPASTFVMNSIDFCYMAIPYAKQFSIKKNRVEAELTDALPFVYDKEALYYSSLLSDKALFKSERLNEGYYNNMELQQFPFLLHWQTDSVLLPVISRQPSLKVLEENVSKKLFFAISENSWEFCRTWIQNIFPTASSFEVPVRAEN